MIALVISGASAIRTEPISITIVPLNGCFVTQVPVFSVDMKRNRVITSPSGIDVILKCSPGSTSFKFIKKVPGAGIEPTDSGL